MVTMGDSAHICSLSPQNGPDVWHDLPVSSRDVEPPRRIGILPIIAAAALFVFVMIVLALPFRHAAAQANAAKAELAIAKQALAKGLTNKAEAATERARSQTDALRESVHSFGGDIWSWVPVLGGSVRDVRALADALDNLTSVMEIGVQTAPQIRGKDATLYADGAVDLDTLEQVGADVEEIDALLESAQSHLSDVGDHRPLIGTRLANARDQAWAQVSPVADSVKTLRPMLDTMPLILGANADRKYLIALLNPAEMQNSGGTPLTFSTFGMEQGRLILDGAVDTTAPGIGEARYWRKVPHNPFHRGHLRLATATMAPDWSVSGEELANAWRSLRGRRLSGIIAIDLVALADLVEVTGPIQHPTLGTLTSENLVEKLVGSYDEQGDSADRKEINRSLAPAFTERLTSGSPFEVGRVLGQAARERRFAVFMRNPAEQAVFDALGVTGRLAEQDRDYVGVFTQNRVASKSDFWQRRAVSSRVSVKPDGSARVTLSVRVHNDSPPYLQSYPDPHSGYFTRWNHLSILTMLPPGAQIKTGTVDGEPFRIQQGNFFGRTFQREAITFAPQAAHTLTISYDVPRAANLRADGTLAYGLALDPQPMVNAQAVRVEVRFPRGYAVGKMSEGWQQRGDRGAYFATPGLETAESFEVLAHP